MTNYDVIRVERKTAELLGINSFVQKRARIEKKPTSGDYLMNHSEENWQHNQQLKKLDQSFENKQ